MPCGWTEVSAARGLARGLNTLAASVHTTDSPLFHSQQLPGIPIRKFSSRGVVQFQAVEPLRCFNHVFIGIVDAEQDSIYADLTNGGLQRTLPLDTRRSDPKVLGKVVA